jgi:hypothetical protein
MMLNYLRRLAAGFLQRRWPFHPFNPPSDPYAAVREPRRLSPGGRSSAVALEEPPPSGTVSAIARNRTMAVAFLVAGGLIGGHAVRAQTGAQATEKPFASGGRIDINLSGGEYEIRAAADNKIRVRLTRNPASTKVDVATTGSTATVRVSNTPHNDFSAIIEVPKVSDLKVHMTGGDLRIAEITGNKDIDSYAGDLTIAVGDPNQYSSVDASVKAGDLTARPFGGSKSGLLQSFTWSGKGKYTLRARLGAGDLVLQ